MSGDQDPTDVQGQIPAAEPVVRNGWIERIRVERQARAQA